MAKLFGKPSSYLKEKDLHYFYKASLTSLGGFGVAFMLFKTLPFYPNKIIGAAVTYSLIVLCGLLFYKAYKEDERISDKYFRGRGGENDIAKELKKLPNTFSIFRDATVEVPANIDFIVFGPTGIFTIEVKSHEGNIGYENGKITRNGYPIKGLKQAKAEAVSLHGYLKNTIQSDVWVKPVLVFSSPKAKVHFGHNSVDGVIVIQKDFLLNVFGGKDLILSSEQLESLENTLTSLVKA